MKRTTIFLTVLVALSLLLASCQPATQAPATSVSAPAATEAPAATQAPVAAEPVGETVVFERSETLYATGDQWGPPSNWNPWNGGGYSIGTLGLIYETLFVYDPMTDEFAPWLAESGTWTDDTTWEVKLRPGIKWSDGEPLSAEDV
jgi:peptide/nickel transport system substrate-binding protein